MDETELIASAQMRILGRAAGLSRESVQRTFEVIFEGRPQQTAPVSKSGKLVSSVLEEFGKAAD